MWSRAPRCEVSLISHTTSFFIRQMVDSHRFTRVRSRGEKNGLNERRGRRQTRKKDHLCTPLTGDKYWSLTTSSGRHKGRFCHAFNSHLWRDVSKVKSKLPAYWTTPLPSVKGAPQSQSCYVFDFTFTKGKGVSKEVIYLTLPLTLVKNAVNPIFRPLDLLASTRWW